MTRFSDPWPPPPPLPGPVMMDQKWTDAVFLHWRTHESTAAAFMPTGVVPDTFDGSSWVGLIGFRMRQAGLGRGPAIPFFGDFNEINVRLYSREPDGTRGVVFLSLDANRLAVVLAARAAGIPYVWSASRLPLLAGGQINQILSPPLQEGRAERFRSRTRSDQRRQGSPIHPPHSTVWPPHQVRRPHAVHAQHPSGLAPVPG